MRKNFGKIAIRPSQILITKEMVRLLPECIRGVAGLNCGWYNIEGAPLWQGAL